MKKPAIGIIYSGRGYGVDEKLFIKLGKIKKIEIVMINISKKMNEQQLRKETENCNVIYNTSAEDFSVEIVKTLEEMGRKVFDTSNAYYYTEDKWMFYLKCKEHKIPVPSTILLSENLISAKKELKEFGRWPVILKRVSGTMGEFVEKADDVEHAEYLIKKFWKKGSEKAPIIAQELIMSPSYRVTVIGNEIVQTALKENKSSWKATGVYAKRFKNFKVDKDLKKIVTNLMKFVKISICGVDLLKKESKWFLLEVNSEPDFGFFENERKRLIGKTLDFLIKKSKTKHHKSSGLLKSH
jgi:RimK family alpha-L-glutamate ligase